MHVGSVDELDHEQGVAHLIEHVTFLGSKKRERILGTGARSNAYTDFHHTVFHVHSPVKSQETGEALLPLVLDALHEVSQIAYGMHIAYEAHVRMVIEQGKVNETLTPLVLDALHELSVRTLMVPMT